MNKLGIAIVILILACLLAVRFYLYNSSKITYQNGQEVEFVERLTSVPESDGRFQRFTLALPSGPRLFITTSRFPEYSYGDVLQVRGKIQKKQYEDRQIHTMSYPKIEVVPDRNVFYGIISSIRERVTTIYQSTLPPTSASLLMGIVFGIKEEMTSEFEDSLRSAGVMHVIAASGMNVSMVAGAVFAIFAAVLNRRRALILSLVAIIFYAFLAGFEASIVRATVMAGIAFAAGYFGRQYFGFLALCLTAYVMLLFNPRYISDVGFQLSFLATLGILYVKPPDLFVKKEKGGGRTKWHQAVRDDLRVTVAATVATLPILLMTFGQYGLLSVPVNALVLWTIPILMIIGSLAAVIGLLLPFLAKPFLFLALPFLWYFEAIVDWAGSLGYSLQVESFSWPLVIGYYLILLALILRKSNIKNQKVKMHSKD